jgi:phospholipase/lecithinase/hemolysin
MSNLSSHGAGDGQDHGGAKSRAKTTNLVFFGDSLTDNGNLFAATGGAIPAAPWWNGRFSNGPTYAEQLPALLGVTSANVQNYAYGGATATVTHVNPPVPVDLDTQVQLFIASLHGQPAPAGTEAVLYIGNNDYLNYVPTAANPPAAEVAAVTGHIRTAIETLAGVGVKKIVLFTLPHFSITPAGQFLASTGIAGATLVAGADAIIDANNAALAQIAAFEAAAGISVTIVDANLLGDAVAADGHAFGFKDLVLPIFTGPSDQLTNALNLFAPNEIAFTNDIHPTYATAGIQAVFAAATLNADHVELFRAGSNTYTGTSGNDFIFAVQGGNTFYGGAGNDIIYSGVGGSTVHGGAGNDLLFAGGGGNQLFGDGGTDLLAVNSGNNALTGGTGNDILIANRSGNTVMTGGGGADLFILKEDAGASFGQETIIGGEGSVLRFIINDQNAAAEAALIAEFNTVADAYRASLHTNHHGTFSVDGLNIQGISGLELQIDSVNAAVPYQIDHTIVQTVGHGANLSATGSFMLTQASLWGLLTA